MMMRLSEAAAALGVRLSGPDSEFARVTTDSRAVQAGDLFVALPGERFDGHEFVAAAFAQGAAGALVRSDRIAALAASGKGFVAVPETRLALGALAAHWRGRMPARIAAVTGSNGKTTVRELVAGILRSALDSDSAVLATEGNLNNDIGVPLTLLRLTPHHRFAVIEMGMNHSGEIDYLARLTRPDVALVNNAGTAHVGNLGSVEAVAKAKGEIFAGLPPEGVAIVNADDRHADLWRWLARGHRAIDFGLAHGAAVGGFWRPGGEGGELAIHFAGGEAMVALQLPGEHNGCNALAATAVAVALGVDLRAAARGLAEARGVKGRLQRKPGRGGIEVIDDTYNANPDSAKAAIAVLARAPGRRVLVLGDMGELGTAAEVMHAEVGAAARAAGIDALYTLGLLSRGAGEAFGAGSRHCERLEDLLAALEVEVAAGNALLVKGSRFMQMERVVAHLMPAGAAAGGH